MRRRLNEPELERPPLLNRLEEMHNLIAESAPEMRRICAELRPAILDEGGLIAAIQWQAEAFETQTEIRCQTNITSCELARSEPRDSHVFRVIQELLTNVAKHAQASAVTIDLQQQEDRLEITVADNGRGWATTDTTVPHFGLVGMRERVHALGGIFHQEEDHGITTHISIPVGTKPAPSERSPVGV